MSKTFDILAIDDEQVILDSIVKLCSIENWNVDTALDAVIGFDKILKNKYKLIISDIMMPQMDGFELLDNLRLKEISTPVIITTGYSTMENAVKSLYGGAIDFLPKPFSIDELISSVSRGLRYGEIQQAIAMQPADNDNDTIYFIPCPAKYYRLGYGSWSYLEDDGSVKIGLTDLFMRTIENIIKIDLLNVDQEIIQGNSCVKVETGDEMIHNALAPLSGRIVKRNDSLLKQNALVEKDPYFRGWLYTIIPSDLDYESKRLIPCTADRI